MGLSTATLAALSTAAATCVAGPPIACAPSVLGFYLTFYNSNTVTSTSLFADAFVGFVEFTPIPMAAVVGATSDTILVALNQKVNPVPTGA